ncbi:LamG-like jellyroll fold domain-containing protein [Tamlana sp. 2201CG12-4]|uniref:LamG domain-containing protein n=1 Tax=Tamlana sp. 2201CG12-4 TaxID=3112582 RepID=UPI002DBAA4D7|nr:LamG-like jellyroll fold domain-containing protein [Tamlana sp. 2201CG12-4]MEC3907849.1 LamG-like jellyroll fold domain-containing protein [Tamlana sp. 2201CG12-4]
MSKKIDHFKVSYLKGIDQFSMFRKPLFLIGVLFFFIPKTIFSQNDLSVDDYAFICAQSPDSLAYNFNKGIRAFILHIEEKEGVYKLENNTDSKDLSGTLDLIELFLEENNQAFISLIFKGTFNQEALKSILKTKFSNRILFRTTNDWPKVNDLLSDGVRIFGVFKSDLVSTTIEQIRKVNEYSGRFSSNPQDKLVLLTSLAETDSILYTNIFELWKSTGKAPNFIISPNIKNNNVKGVSDSLNRMRRFRGVIEYKGKPLNEISWTNSPKIITPSKFSFPLIEKEIVLSPYKNGYRITPAEVIHHAAQNDVPRFFSAYDVPIEDKLAYDFSFEERVENTVDVTWDRSISKDVSYVNDPERGHVLHFANNDSYIDYSKENILDFKSPISVSVWVKPDSIPEYAGIVSFGMAFSLKLRSGSPDFTMATVKDHVIEQPLKTNTWQHLVVVHNPKTMVEFFLNGNKIGEVNADDIIPSKQSLVIGNNIWGEQFYGSIDDLKIWDRGLSLKEVEELFNKDKPINNSAYYIISGLFVLIVLGLIFVFKRKKETFATSEIYAKPELENKTAEGFKGNTLHLFGNFQIDLTSEKKLPPSFSPLNKELLSFILLSILEDEDGVSTNKLTDTFWPGVSKLKAKENRNGNIGKLRKVLSHIDGLDVIFDDKKWQVKTSENFEVDIFKYKKIKKRIKDSLNMRQFSTDEFNNFLDLLKKGNILQNTQTEWVDYFKNKISNEVESVLSKVYKTQSEFLPSQLNIKLAETILLFDNLNENALKILINELVSTGKHGLAKNTYNAFSKNYKTLYGEVFGVDYQDFVKK